MCENKGVFISRIFALDEDSQRSLKDMIEVVMARVTPLSAQESADEYDSHTRVNENPHDTSEDLLRSGCIFSHLLILEMCHLVITILFSGPKSLSNICRRRGSGELYICTICSFTIITILLLCMANALSDSSVRCRPRNGPDRLSRLSSTKPGSPCSCCRPRPRPQEPTQLTWPHLERQLRPLQLLLNPPSR